MISTAINNAEKALGIKYPKLIREKLEQNNGFIWGGFEFFCVFDEDNRNDSFDDVVKENTNPGSGWLQYIPEGYVCIAAADEECLLLNKNQDGKLYYYVNDGFPREDEFITIFENAEALAEMLDETDLRLQLSAPADGTYFIKMMMFSVRNEIRSYLIFHNNMVYATKVEINQTLDEVLKKEIKQITGHEQYRLNKIYDDGFDFDKTGKPLKRYGLILQVSYFDAHGNKAWVEDKKLYNTT